MYKLKEIKHALKILEQYDFQFSKASKATGIKGGWGHFFGLYLLII